MVAKNFKTSNSEVDKDVQTIWLSWCRLCAKRELTLEECSSIFVKNETGKLGLELATTIGKYFWVNIKTDDEISKCICLECRQLLDELVAFTERVNKVQTLFCLLQNIQPSTVQQTDKLRSQCGLVDEGWQHIIKPQLPKVQESLKPLLIDQETQTEPLTAVGNRKGDNTNNQGSNETEEIIDIVRKHEKYDESYSQTETEVEQIYEYVVQGENDMDCLENNEYIVSSNDDVSEEKKPNTEEVENLNTDLERQLVVSEDSELKETSSLNITSEKEDLVLDYENEEDADNSIEMLVEEEYDEFSSKNKMDIQMAAMALLKGKRGRPLGTKYSDRFDCKECKRKYKNPNIFRKHMSSLHNIVVDDMPEFKSKSNICTVCNKLFMTSSSLKLHMRHHLPDEEKFSIPCPYCDRKFSQVGAMRTHVNGIHHQMKPFICDQCGRAVKTMAALNEHQLVHTNECPFKCEVCHKSFKNKPRLKSHMETHTEMVYKCQDCGLELNTKRTFLQHQLVHSDVKRYKCQFCDAAFKRTKALKNHLILHTGLRPYICNFCKKSFSNGSNCRAHKKRTHPRELAEEEARGIGPERVPIPRLEELKSAKGVLVQPRKIKRHAGGLTNHLRKLLQSSEKSRDDSNDYEGAVENYETLSDFHYEICKSEIEDTESLADNPSEECEETVIYEIIDEI